MANLIDADNLSTFCTRERDIQRYFFEEYTEEIRLISSLIKSFSKHILDAGSSTVTGGSPEFTATLILSQIPSLANVALDTLSKGYPRISEATLRIISEALLLGLYFFTFPSAEIDYGQLSREDFAKKHPMHKMMKKVQESPTAPRSSEGIVNLQKLLHQDIYSEGHRFIHQHPGLIYALTKEVNQQPAQETRLVIGPQKYSRKILSADVARLMHTLTLACGIISSTCNLWWSHLSRQ